MANNRLEVINEHIHTGLAFILSNRAGRRWLYNTMVESGVDMQSYNCEDKDPRHDAYREGRRSVGLQIKAAVLSYGVEYYIMMLNENLKQEGEN